MGEKILLGLLPLLGLFAGWILNGFSEKNKTNKKNKKELKRALFNLLEIYHLLSWFESINKYVENYIEIIKEENVFFDLTEAVRFATTNNQGRYKKYALQSNTGT